MSKISVLLPTRKRIANFTRFYKSIEETAVEFPEIVVFTDNDDTASYDFIIGLKNTHVINGPRIILSDVWNKCYDMSTGDILMLAGDDIVFRTRGWDIIVKEAFEKCPDKILYAHGADGDFNETLGTHGFIHRKWAQTVGYFVPPYFTWGGPDQWLDEIAKALGRKVYLPFYTEHIHPNVGKAELDDTYREGIARGDKGDTWRGTYHLRLEDAEKLRKVMTV